jgi:hypothetical protein
MVDDSLRSNLPGTKGDGFMTGQDIILRICLGGTRGLPLDPFGAGSLHDSCMFVILYAIL